MRIRGLWAVLGLVAVLVAAASGQSVEATVFLPDSFGGLKMPNCLAYDSADNTVFVAGETTRTILVLNAKDGHRLGELRSTGWGASAVSTDLHRAAPIVPGLEPRAVALGKDRVRIVWDALTHPAMCVYSGGEALREAAGGCVDVTTASPRLTLKLSDNLRNLTFDCEVKAAP